MAGGSLLMDDTINDIFSNVPVGRGVLLLSDSCFSGTVTRWADVRDFGLKRRFVDPSTFTDLLPAQVSRTESITVRSDVKPGAASLISGCSDMEFSYDAWFGGRPNGAFTRAAIDAYVPGASLAAWFKAIRVALPSPTYPQTPELTAASLYRRYAKAL
jgi:hypothetical protein